MLFRQVAVADQIAPARQHEQALVGRHLDFRDQLVESLAGFNDVSLARVEPDQSAAGADVLRSEPDRILQYFLRFVSLARERQSLPEPYLRQPVGRAELGSGPGDAQRALEPPGPQVGGNRRR